MFSSREFLRHRKAGFTLVELLVVIGIVGVLISILVPALSKARKAAAGTYCMNNMRQLGMGFLTYTDRNKGFLPWTGAGDGDKISKPLGPWNDPFYWVNAVPPLVNGYSYYDLQQQASHGGSPIGKSTDHNLFVCPLAEQAASKIAGETANGVFRLYGNPEGSWPQYLLPIPAGASVLTADQRDTFWCYVINSKLDNSRGTLKIAQIKHSTEVALLVEKATTPADCTPSFANQSLARGKTTWTRFTNRHNGGGYILFVDGHVGFCLNSELEAPNGSAPFINPAYNLPGKVIWDPFQKPLYGS
ncbi:MAG TPA: prepilin-type N-terminal cleavage/methylation domain-containing protein [Tepidisphaeraceae bacterium]|nr:prepilin-type N-terminal cleavage/methylation domain-containing protein [Tepidisphaeraceae bacterium]